ncbi:MAG: heavy metal translocating P-type ATPase [Lysinibacillus sp.]
MTTKAEEYRLANLSCASCAAKFEKNVSCLPDVEQVQVNFGAAKLKVVGDVTIEQLEEAGAFDNIKVRPVSAVKEQQIPFYKRKENVLAAISLVFVLIGLVFSLQRGEGNIISNINYFIAIVIGGMSIFITGFKNLLKLSFDMKTLMTVAIIGAAIIGEWQEAAVVVFLFAVSEALEAYSMNKARQSIEQLVDLAPPSATVKIVHGEHEHQVEKPTEDIVIGDILIVKPGQKIAMDGIVEMGQSYVNEATITGESVPVEKDKGSVVYAGTLNEEGYMEVRVTKLVADSTIAKIIHLVEEAQAEKAPSQKFVDRFAKYYTPLIMLVALLVAVVPGFVTGDWQQSIYQGLAVLVVGCPCALVISTPVAIVTAIGNAAKRGVLIKGGIHLEQLASIDTVAFDKTGTLTKGMPEVTDIALLHGTEEDILALAAAVEVSSQHPLAKAVIAIAKKKDVEILKASNFQSVTGKGAYATVNEEKVFVGSIEWLISDRSTTVSEIVDRFAQEGKSVIGVATEQHVLGIIAIADAVRKESRAVIKQLTQLNIETLMLTGDDKVTATAIAQELQIEHVQANLLPEQKLTAIQQLASENKKVAMLGDGVNDAPALASANVGIAMGAAGTDAALETADIVLMSDDLKKLPFTIQLSKKTLRIIQQNITFALGLKIIALLLVIPGWLTLWIAIFADIGATLLVILNSLRLVSFKN